MALLRSGLINIATTVISNKLIVDIEDIRYLTTYTGAFTWRAVIGVKGKQIRLGNFKTIEEAIKIRKEAELFYYGELSR